MQQAASQRPRYRPAAILASLGVLTGVLGGLLAAGTPAAALPVEGKEIADDRAERKRLSSSGKPLPGTPELGNLEERISRRGLPEAILLDWNMPKMDGYEFLRSLRRRPGGDGPKVVFCTTENDVAHIARALHAGANEYIMKPFDREIVEAKFQEVGLI